MSTAVQPISGSFAADTVHSSFGFAVRHMGVAAYRGTFSDVNATLTETDGELQLVGTAKAESISIVNPPEFRAHVLGDDFFAADKYPEITYRSNKIDLAEDGTATVEGELTIRGISKPVVAEGTYTGATQDPWGGTRASLELEAKVSRSDYGMTWNTPLPNGGDALANEVVITVHLELVGAQA